MIGELMKWTARGEITRRICSNLRGESEECWMDNIFVHSSQKFKECTFSLSETMDKDNLSKKICDRTKELSYKFTRYWKRFRVSGTN